MVLGDRLGFGGLLVAVVGVALVYLWPDKKWIGWLFLGVAAILAASWATLEVRQRLGNSSASFWISIAIGAIFGAMAAALIWQSARPTIPITEAAKPEGKPPAKPPVSLRELFENDWPNLPAYYNTSTIHAVSRQDNKTQFNVMVAWRLNGDFIARSKFLAFFIESAISALDAVRTCEAIADSYNQFIDSANSQVDISGQAPDDTSSTYLRDMVFSKRIFIYYENPDFSLTQKGSIESLFNSKGLSVQFRDAAYAWSHRDDRQVLRPKPLVPNSTLLPDAHTNPGLVINVKVLK